MPLDACIQKLLRLANYFCVVTHVVEDWRVTTPPVVDRVSSSVVDC